MAKISILTDNFDDNSINGTLWGTFTSNSATLTEQNQRLEMALANSTSDSNATLFSQTTWDFTDSSVYLQLAQVADQTGTVFVFRLENDGSHYVDVQVFEGNIVANFDNGAGQQSSGALTTYGSGTQWLRLRHDSVNIYWDTSANGTSWNNQTSLSVSNFNNITLTALQVTLVAYEYSSVNPAGTYYVDNFNTTVAAPTATASKRLLMGHGR